MMELWWAWVQAFSIDVRSARFWYGQARYRMVRALAFMAAPLPMLCCMIEITVTSC